MYFLFPHINSFPSLNLNGSFSQFQKYLLNRKKPQAASQISPYNQGDVNASDRNRTCIKGVGGLRSIH